MEIKKQLSSDFCQLSYITIFDEENQYIGTFLQRKKTGVYLSPVKVQISATRKNVYLVFVYGLLKQPMMLVTNKVIHAKALVIQVAKIYFSRWCIEEYFRCKKQVFQFENFRVRKLVSIKRLNFYISLCMAFLALVSMASETHALKVSILQTANAFKSTIIDWLKASLV